VKQTVQDKIVAYVAERPGGVTSVELARVFLAPAAASEALCERLIAGVLESESRVIRTPDGVWVLARPAPVADADDGFTVIECCEVVASGGRVPLEWAAVRVDPRGHIGERRGGVIRPERALPGALVPPHLRGRLREGVSLADAFSAAAEFVTGAVVSVHPGSFQDGVVRLLRSSGRRTEQLYLGRLARRAIGRDIRTMEDLAGRLGVAMREPQSAAERADFIAELLAAMISQKEKLGLGDPSGWVERQRPVGENVDFSRFDFDRDFIEGLPQSPGVYTMYDASGKPIYVGKAANLRRRVGDYFRARVQRDEKEQRILEDLYAIDVEETGSELAAILLEQQRIKELKPAINIQFDVHDRTASQRAPTRRWVVVLPAVAPEEAEVFLFHGNRALRRVVIPRDDPGRLRPIIEEFFFGPPPPPPSPEEEEALRLAWSWLERHRDAANAFDVELAGGLDETMRLLARYLSEHPSSGRVFHV